LLTADVYASLEPGVVKTDILRDEDASMTDTCRPRRAELNEDLEAAVASRLPTLLTGPKNTTDDWIHYVEPRLARPVIEIACGAGVKMTALAGAGTVIFHDVEALRPADQLRLLRWFQAPHRPQVISTSSRALYPLVRAGRLSEDLYYRLNGVYLDGTNATIVDLLELTDEDEWIAEFPAEERVQAEVRVPVSSVPSTRLLTEPTRLALMSCTFGMLIGALSMWVVTAQFRSAIVPVASAARIQEGPEQPALPSQQDENPAASLQGSPLRNVSSTGATAGQAEAVADARTVQQAAARPRRTVYRGALTVNSRPSGARVSINGQSLGVTPLRVNRLPAGSRVVRLTAQGYHPWSNAVRVVANQRNSVMATLQPLRD
jgi:hypothetical protein